MRPVREITAEEENFRTEPKSNLNVIRRDGIKPEPEGTIILMPFRIKSYSPDCDGSLMATLESINSNGEESGWCPNNLGLYSESGLVVSEQELKDLFNRKE